MVAEQQDRFVAGCMSGTSCDGVDVALVRIRGSGLAMTATIEDFVEQPLSELGASLRAFADGAALSAAAVVALGQALADAHVRAIQALARQPDFVAVHGQTVWHGGQGPGMTGTWQVIDLPRLAYALGCPVVGDLRSADIALDGQGAPITPLADALLYRTQASPIIIVNLGGFINWTFVPAQGFDLQGRDLCACNQLLNAITRKHGIGPYDPDGRHGMRGSIQPADFNLLRSYLHEQRLATVAGASLGTVHAPLDMVEQLRSNADDQLAAACAAIAQVLADQIAILPTAPVVFLAGGGVRNDCLAQAICRQISGVRILPQAQAREAAAMAVLGALAADRTPFTIPAVTGRRETVQDVAWGTWVGRRLN